jgi:hypothetical protein
MMKKLAAQEQGILDKFKLIQGADGEYILSVPIEAAPKRIPTYYGFSTDRHSGSFFLKIGAAIFCLGSLVHTGLNIGRTVIVFLDLLRARNALIPVSIPARVSKRRRGVHQRRAVDCLHHEVGLHLSTVNRHLPLLERDREPPQVCGSLCFYALHSGVALPLAARHPIGEL